MKYRYKFKGKTVEEKEQTPKSNLHKKKKMLLLMLWSAVAIGLYLAFSRVFAMTTIQVCEALVFLGLLGYLINIFRIRGAVKKEPENVKRIVKLENFGKYLLIFILPLIFIILFDFVVTSFKMLGK